MKKIFLFLTSAVIITAQTNAQKFLLLKNTLNPKDAVYTPSDSPAYGTWSENTYTELGWTDIEVTETDNVSLVHIDYTWNTSAAYYFTTFLLESPSGTQVILAKGESYGTFSKTLTDFCGEPMNGTWKLWIEDGTGLGFRQATDITVSFYSQHTHDLSVREISPEYVSSGTSAYPQAKVFNLGSVEESTYTVTISDGSGYSETVTVSETIPVNSSTVVDFPLWSPSDGIYTMTASVSLTGDEDPENDSDEGICYASPGDYTQGKVYGYDAWGANTFHSVLINIENGNVSPIQNPYLEYFGLSAGVYDIIRDEIIAIGGIDQRTVYIITAEGKAIKIGTLTGMTGNETAYAIAHDHINDIYYISGMDYPSSSNMTFYSVDENWNCTALPNQTDKWFLGMACDAYGVLYGVESTSNNLWIIDKTTGNTILVGSLDISIGDNFDIGCDKTHNILYGTLGQNVWKFGKINKTNGHFKEINPDLGGQIYMCAVVPGHTEQAPITFKVDSREVPSYTGFALKGSWDADGYYDATWNGGAEHTVFYDDGTHGDPIGYDDIWCVTVYLYCDEGANTWEWSVNDQDGNPLEGDFETFTIPNTYNQSVMFTVPLDINSLLESEIKIYPNPSDKLTVECKEPCLISLLDISGRRLKEFGNIKNKAILDLSDQAAGIYFLKFRNENMSVTRKIIIQ